MRAFPLFVLVAGCTAPPWDPACVANGRTHTCSNLVPRSCTDMFVMSGLRVDFTGAAPEQYDVVLFADDETIGFTCDAGTVLPTTGGDGVAWFCDGSGFTTPVRGDHLEITVTVDGQPTTLDVDPCWNVSEPNGQCCGFGYSATVEVALD